jgi:hypothetical protein
MSFVSLSYELTHELRFELTQMPRYGFHGKEGLDRAAEAILLGHSCDITTFTP